MLLRILEFITYTLMTMLVIFLLGLGFALADEKEPTPVIPTRSVGVIHSPLTSTAPPKTIPTRNTKGVVHQPLPTKAKKPVQAPKRVTVLPDTGN